MVTHNGSTPGQPSGLTTAGGTPATGPAADLQVIDKRLDDLQRLLDKAARQGAVVTRGSAVLAELARQARARFEHAGPAADEAKLDELAELLRRQAPARQAALMELLEGETTDDHEDEDEAEADEDSEDVV